ncbi:MAG: lysophospholipid acyltransferase family protein [Methylomonas sp.]|nr:lysophospholipid acyltransferase family protein [Methylomonas sp.]
MFKQLNYYWRLVGTGLSFFMFGACGVLVWGLGFPLFEKFLGVGGDKKRRSRLLMSRIFRSYMAFMRLIGILNYRVSGRDRLLAPGRLVVANHPCLLDIVFLISQIPNATCIVKPALIRNPFMRIPIQAMGYIYAEDPEVLVEHCEAELREGGNLIIFPEGTRTTPGKAIKFQRGAAAIALQAQAPILPVILDCSPTTLTKREKWYQIPEKKFTLTMDVRDHMRLTPVPDNTSRSLASRRLTRQLEAYFVERLAENGKS